MVIAESMVMELWSVSGRHAGPFASHQALDFGFDRLVSWPGNFVIAPADAGARVEFTHKNTVSVISGSVLAV